MHEWWGSKGRSQYRSIAEFARVVGVRSHQMWDYLGGRFRPDGERRARLYETTELPCFAPDIQPEWVKELESRATAYIDSLPAAFATKKRHREFTRRILVNLASAGITAPTEITGAVLLKHPPSYKPDQTKRIALGVFAHLLVELGIWTGSQEDEFKTMLRYRYPHNVRQAGQKSKTLNQLGPMGASIASLVVNGGLGAQQVRKLRITKIEPGGIRVGKNQLLRFGGGWHQIPKSVIDAYLQDAKPQDYLFYSYRPRDYHRPVSRKPIMDALKGAHAGRAGSPVEMAHFDEDARHIENPRRLRAHFRHFHDLSGRRTWLLMKKFYDDPETFVLPEPYILAVVCVSRLLRDAASRQRGHSFAYTWHGMCGGRYDVTVSWPVSLFQKLRDGRNKPGVARLLLKFGEERWEDGRHGLTDRRAMQTSQRLIEYWRKAKHPMSRKVHAPNLLTEGVDRDTLNQLEVTQVEILSKDGAKWSGSLLNRTKKGILLPLLDQLEGGPTNSRCPICGHPERDAIDAEIRSMRSGQDTFAEIARKYGLAYGPNEGQLLWHAGRIIHNNLPSHMGSASPAVVVRCTMDLLSQIARANAQILAERLLRLVNADRQTLALVERPQLRKSRSG